MKTICSRASLAGAALALGIFFLTPANASTGDFYPSYLQAKVIAHLPMSGATSQMFLERQGRKLYLYMQQPQQAFTVVDVTNPAKPKTVSHVSHANLITVSSGLAIAEQPQGSATVRTPAAAGSAEGTRGGGGGSAPTVRVLDVSNPAHPQTVRTFSGVTNILSDEARGLIYVANGDGIWILSHQQVLRRYECSSSDAISPIPNCD